jgi:hypothetical protein
MYPKHFLDLFHASQYMERVFVAMPFRDWAQDRWINIIKPAVEKSRLEPYRVDIGKSGDSIMIDILHNISEARLILCEVSKGPDGNRNPNVMYELGLAHASRLPEEVVVIRVDNDHLPFDVAQFRLNTYDASSPDKAQDLLAEILEDRLKEIDLLKTQQVEMAFRQLDQWCVQWAIMSKGSAFRPPLGSGSQAIQSLQQAVPRLLEKGLIILNAIVDEKGQYVYEYNWTEFGKAVIRRMSLPFES